MSISGPSDFRHGCPRKTSHLELTYPFAFPKPSGCFEFVGAFYCFSVRQLWRKFKKVVNNPSFWANLCVAKTFRRMWAAFPTCWMLLTVRFWRAKQNYAKALDFWWQLHVRIKDTTKILWKNTLNPQTNRSRNPPFHKTSYDDPLFSYSLVFYYCPYCKL